MNIAKRIFLYLLTNLFVVLTISIVLNALGVQSYLTEQGIDYQSLAVICLVWGMTGSLISLWMSRMMAKIWMRITLIDPSNPKNEKERELIKKISHLSHRLGLKKMPEVGIYASSDLNAFATGPTKNRSLVAVSSGLLSYMNSDELEGVLAHEMSHINNGDMVTMTLLQGIVNAFSLFLSRILAYALINAWIRNDEKNKRHSFGIFYYLLRITFDILITLLGSIVVAAFSRYREYRADAGGARLVGRQKMIAGLERLRNSMQSSQDQEDDSAVSALQINRKPKKHNLWSWLATHPDIDLRIAALKKNIH